MRMLTVNEFKEQFDAGKYFGRQVVYKKQNKTTTAYMTDFCTFDTEVTTIVTKKELNKRTGSEDIEAKGLLYIWQICIFGEYVVYGRYLHEFAALLVYLREHLLLSNKRRMCIYVHNLEYDAQFILPYLERPQIFATDKRSILYIRDKGFEFRCSYKLTNMTLKKFLESENVPHQKQDGEEFDYKKIRTPDTQLTDNELYYCYCDIVGLHEAITNKLINEGDNLATIPFTSTGYCRRLARNAMQKNPVNRKIFEKCSMDEHLYSLLRKSFRGGNTHANRNKAGKIVNNVVSYDLASSYPSVIMYSKFPMTEYKNVEIKSTDDLLILLKGDYCLIVDVTFKNIRTNNPIPYIPVDKCEEFSWDNCLTDNGRVLYADKIRMVLLDQDIRIILKMYDIDEIEVNECLYSLAAKLPKELREVVSTSYNDKTRLKKVKGQEYFYSKQKNLLNSYFGMMVQDPVTEPIKWTKGEWTKGVKDVHNSLKHFNNSRNSFLVYAWGCVITAEARVRLQEGLDIVGNNIVYTDTDSLKFIYDKDICDKLEKINIRIEAEAMKSDVSCISYTKDGEKQVMGMWDNEGVYDKFVTYGAKKYASEKHGEFEVTVAGLNKKKGAKEFGCIENFILGTTIEDSGRTRAIYDDDIKTHYVEVEGKKYEIRSNIAIVDTTYTLGVTQEYLELCPNIYEY